MIEIPQGIMIGSHFDASSVWAAVSLNNVVAPQTSIQYAWS